MDLSIFSDRKREFSCDVSDKFFSCEPICDLDRARAKGTETCSNFRRTFPFFSFFFPGKILIHQLSISKSQVDFLIKIPKKNTSRMSIFQNFSFSFFGEQNNAPVDNIGPDCCADEDTLSFEVLSKYKIAT